MQRSWSAVGKVGAVLSNSDELAQFVRSWRDYCDQPADGTRLNDQMTDLEATLVLCQLERLRDSIRVRRGLAERYHELLVAEAGHDQLFRLPEVRQSRIWYRYAVELTQASARQVVDRMQAYGVVAAEPVTDWRTTRHVPVPGCRSCLSLLVVPSALPQADPERAGTGGVGFFSSYTRARHG